MAADPVFAATPRATQCRIDTANTARDGSGAAGLMVPLFTAGAAGSKIEEIHIVATVTTTTGMVRLFVSYDGGTTKRLLRERTVTAITVSATVAAFWDTISFNNFVLPAAAIVYAATEKSEAINVLAFGGDF